MSRLQPLIDWTRTARETSWCFDNEADTLLTRLALLQEMERAAKEAASAPASIGIYGHSPASRAWLLQTLCGDGERVPVCVGGRQYDWLTHLNPEHAPARLALRFSSQSTSADRDFPLRLTLMREADLVQLFISVALSQPGFQPASRAAVAERLRSAENLRQTRADGEIDAGDVAVVARFCQQRIPARFQQPDDLQWQQMFALLPGLTLGARANIWALLWGEQPALTAQWLELARALQRLGDVRQVAAPLSLLADDRARPNGAFLTPDSEMEGDVRVQPIGPTGPRSSVNLPASTLARLCVELTLPAARPLLDKVDIIDIPAPPAAAADSFDAVRSRWLLEHYRERLEPDLLLICNAVETRGQIPGCARRLLRWSGDTQPDTGDSPPGLVWAITPHDNRLLNKEHLDEGVQRMLEKPGQRWGTLQAIHGSGARHVTDWLMQSVTPARRHTRLHQIEQQIWHQAQALMYPCLPTPTQDLAKHKQRVETMVRELQQRASTLGDLLEALLPPQDLLIDSGRIQRPHDAPDNALFNETVSLFAHQDDIPGQQSPHLTRGAAAHASWVNYLRQWSRNDTGRFGLGAAALQLLVECLISASYRLNLAGKLQAAIDDDAAREAPLRIVISDWLTWLGYADTAPETRPSSAYARGCPLFAPPAAQSGRLTRLAEAPEHAATRYVYDWLLALYIRATEAPDYRPPGALGDEPIQRLTQLLRSCA